MKVAKNSTVSVEYTGTLADGSIFDASSEHGKPLTFVAGAGQVVPGFDDAVMGMKQGEEKTFTISAGDAYGERTEELVQKIRRQQLPQGMEPAAGMMLTLQTPEGQQIPATVSAVDTEAITLDLNH
ncbi:peptidylprolyl isomerase, partial [Candidatus Woesearchaeota archaeon CG11_big_fil_rev_8_21_14_0_20_57_5]